MSYATARDRIDAATPGPWRLAVNDSRAIISDYKPTGLFIGSTVDEECADLIAHCPTDLSAALDVIEKADKLRTARPYELIEARAAYDLARSDLERMP